MISKDSEKYDKLYNELKKEVKKANQRIDRIEKTFGTDSWAIKRLRPYLEVEKLDAITKSGHVSVRKNMSFGQLQKINNFVKKFLASETSTVRGIKDVRIRTIKSLQKYYSTPNLKISYDEAETLYELQNSDDYNWIFTYIEPSEFWAIVEEAINYNWSEEKFVEELLIHYIHEGNDVNMIAKLQALYKHLVKQIRNKR